MSISYKMIKRWYLEMDKKPEIDTINYPSNISIKVFSGNVSEYRILNRLIGEDIGWIDRQIMDDSDLEQIIRDQNIKIYVLYECKEPVGYTEIDYRNRDIPVLEYFGLAPTARGKGLGKFFLQWTLEEVWKSFPVKFKLTTSEQDHPKALPNYLKAGFIIVDERLKKQAISLGPN